MDGCAGFTDEETEGVVVSGRDEGYVCFERVCAVTVLGVIQ